jgi:replicative DNA helicase
MDNVTVVLERTADEIDKKFSEESSEDKLNCSFGIEELDRLTGGIQAGEVTLVCSTAKQILTSFATKVAISNAVGSDNPVFVFNTASKSTAFCKLAISNLELIELNKLYTGAINDADWESLCQALGKLDGSSLYFKDLPEQTSCQISEEVHKFTQEANENSKRVQLIIVDNLETLGRTSPVSNLLEAYFRSGEDLRCFSLLARTLNVPVLVLTGLQRQKEKIYDKFYSLRELPSELLPFAANVIFLNHEPEKQEVEIQLAQSSAGKLGKIKCYTSGSALVAIPDARKPVQDDEY